VWLAPSGTSPAPRTPTRLNTRLHRLLHLADLVLDHAAVEHRVGPVEIHGLPGRSTVRSPRLMDRLRPDARVRSTEYGTGTIESVAGNRIIIWWDRPMLDSRTHRLDHHKTFVETLELLD
jgi:hypothetical protein